MSLFSWPDGWRLPGDLPRYDTPDPAPAPVYAARALAAEDFAAILDRRGSRRVCVGCSGSDECEMVVWHGDVPCFACGGPGLLRDGAA